jgi:hypothetical protein
MSNEAYCCEANACQCKTCNSIKLHQTKIKEPIALVDRVNLYIEANKSNSEHAISFVDFSWIFEKISPLTEKMPGVGILIPDTIIFKDCKAQFIAKYDKEKEYIIRVTNPAKLSMQNLSKTFITYSMSEALIDSTSLSKFPSIKGRNESVPRLKSTITTSEDKSLVKAWPLKVIFRERNNELERPNTNENAFIEEKSYAENELYFRKQIRGSQKSEYFMKLQAMQHYIKPWPMQTEICNFVAPLNEFRSYQEIDYLLEDFGRLELLRTDKEKYLKSQCYKIAFYISKLYGIVLL